MLLCESDEDCNGEDRCEIGQDEVGVCVSAACSPSTVDAPPPSISDDATASDAGSATGAGSGGGGGGCALTAQRAPIPLVGYGLCLLLSLLLWMRRFRILPAPTRRHSKR
jgi:hypothetical protein